MLLQIELLEKIDQFSKKGENRMERIVLYVLALLPLLSIVSLLLLAILLFPITLLPNSILPVAPIYIVELILGILLGLYGFRLRRLQIDNKLQIIYWILLGVSAGVLLLLKYRLIILFQPILPIVYLALFEQRFQAIKKFFQKSIGVFAFFNLFDTLFIGLCFLIKNNVNYIENVLSSFFEIFNELHLSQKVFETTVIILISLLLFIFLPLLKGSISVWIYKRQNEISVQSGKVLWNSYLEAYFGSTISVLMYLSLLLQVNDLSFSTVFTLFLPMSINICFWMQVYENINRGGEDKESEISKWTLIGTALFILFLLDQIESDLIGIFTWFLPIFIPSFIGGINLQQSREKYSKFTKTLKLKKHLHWLQIVSFNTLFILNVLSSLFTKKIIKNNEIVEINTLKDAIANAINYMLSMINKSTSPNFVSNILATTIIIVFSYSFAQWMSKKIIKRLKRYYLDSSKGYFN